MPDKIKEVYELISDKGYFSDENEFRNYVSDPNRRSEAFELIKDDGFFTDKAEFDSYFADEKKKFGLEDFNKKYGTTYTPSEFGAVKPSQSKSTSISTTTTIPKQKVEQPKTPSSRVKLYGTAIQSIQGRIPQLVEQLNQAEAMGDVQAAEQLQAQINADSEKLNYFDRAIQGQKQLAAMQDPKGTSTAFVSGLEVALGNMARGPQAIEEAVMRVGAEAMGVDMKTFQNFLQLKRGASQTPSDVIARAAKPILERGQTSMENMAMQQKYDGSAWEALKKGDVSAGVENAYLGFMHFLPSSLSYINLGTALAMSGGMVGEEVQAAENEGVATSKDVLAGSLKAGLEVVSERLFGAGKAAKELVGKFGKDGAEKIIRETAEGLVNKSLGRKITEQIIEEPVSEAANQLGSNMVDKYLSGKDVSLTDGLGDAAILGLFGGAVQGTPTVVLSHYIDRAKVREYEAKKSQAEQLVERAAEEQSPVVADAIEAEAEKLNDEADAIAKEQNEVGENALPETVEAIESGNAELDELEAALEQVEPELVPIIEARIEEKQKDLEELNKQAKLEAAERLRGKLKELDTLSGINEASTTQVIPDEVQTPQAKSGEPSKSDKNYQEAQEINSIVSKENPKASVLIQPKGNDLVLTAIYVGKENRGGGIGTKVLESVKAQAKKVGKKVVLDATNELDQETDLERLGKFYERNEFKKVGENTYEYDPKDEVSSRDTGARTDNRGAEVGDIASVTDKGESGKEVVAETEVAPALRDVDFTEKGGNKVVDEKGEPLIVYHGTNKEFDKIDVDKPQRGLFFAKNKSTAESYANANNKKGKVIEANINLKNPHIIDAKGKSYDEIIVDLDKVDMATGKGVSKKMSTDEIVDALRGKRSESIITNLYGTKTKADGIIIKNVRDKLSKQSEPTDIYIPFKNEQIKEQPQVEAKEVPALEDVESTAKALETDSDGNFVPKKYTLNRKGENPAPNIPISAIDKESSALEDVEDVAQVKLLEIRGKNSQGQTVGTVWIQKNDGQSYSAEVFFNDAELKAVESLLSKEQPQVEAQEPILSENAPSESKQQPKVKIPIKIDNKEFDVEYVGEYKGMKIVKISGLINVYNPKEETLFNIALDDTKTSGSKNISEEASTVENAKKYIDWVIKATKENKKVSQPIEIKEAKTFSLGGSDTFYHASSTKRKGRLKSSNAPQFGTGIYFSTNKDLVKDEFGDNLTEVKLTINKPVYTNTKEWSEVTREAIRLADKEYGKRKGLVLEEGETYFRYDPENLSEIDEIESNYISDAAKKLGYDAIIDKDSGTYENEIVVLDETKIVYPEDLEQNTNETLVKINKGEKIIYHHTNDSSTKLENRDGGTWFTENQSGYRFKGRNQSAIKRVINPKNLKLATQKQFDFADGSSVIEKIKSLKEQGFDGIKRTIDGDVEYNIFDLKNVTKPKTIEQDEKTNQKENVEPVLEGLRADRNEEQGGQESAELRASKEKEEVKPKKDFQLTKDEYVERERKSDNYPVMDSLWERNTIGRYNQLIKKAIDPYWQKDVGGNRFYVSDMVKSIESGEITNEEAISIIKSAGLDADTTIINAKPNSKWSNKKIEVATELNEEEVAIVEETKITKNEAKRAKQASPKRTRKSKDIAKVIESEAKDVEDSGDADRAADIISTIETAENAILTDKPTNESFEKEHGVSEVELAAEYNSMDKNADIFKAYEALTGKPLETDPKANSFNPSQKTKNVLSKFLEALGIEGIKLKRPLGVEGLVVKTYPKPAKPLKKSGVDVLEKIVAKDPLRPNLESVFFDGDNMIATDAHQLVVIKRTETDAQIISKAKEAYIKANSKIFGAKEAKQIADKKYAEIEKNGLDGSIINIKTGDIVDGKYPQYREVIPNNILFTKDTPIQELIDIANGAFDTLSSAMSKDYSGVVVFNVKSPEGDILIGINSKYLLDNLQSLQAAGAKTVKMSLSTPNRAVIFDTDNGNKGLVMPVLITEEYEDRKVATTEPFQLEVSMSEKDKSELLGQLKNKEKKLKDGSERAELRERIKKLESLTEKSKADKAIATLEKLKVDTKNKSFDAVLGIPVGVWNATIDTITLSIKSGVAISDAIKRGLNYIQKNHRGAWDKKGFNAKVIEELGLRGIEVNGEDLIVKPIEKEFASVVDGFYSDLEQSLLDTRKDNLSGSEWISTLSNNDEANWTGLTGWLNSQEGKVSKSDIQQYLKDNRIEVVEVVKGAFSQKEIIAKKEWIKNRQKELQEEDGEDAENLSFYKEIAESQWEEEVAPEVEDDTKFSQYQLEGEKENYKEVLVTLPKKQSKYAKRFKQLLDIGGFDKRTDAEQKEFLDLLDKDLSSEDKSKEFYSSHFDEPNILVHLRMNTRTDSKGNKVLFLEEIQSDWGQKGKKEGFAIPKNKVDKDLERFIELQSKKTITIDESKELDGLWDKMSSRYGIPNMEGIDADPIAYYRYKVNEQKQGIPSAPFVTDTNAWTKLGLKVALKEAVNQNADKIAWTTGEQQNERYDLSKSVKSVYAQKGVDGVRKGKFYVEAKSINGADALSGWYTPQELEGIVGKDLAEKISKVEDERTFEGVDLKVGGKGMKGFYGSPTEGSLGIVGSVAKSLFKQEPKTVEIDTNERGKRTKDFDDLKQSLQFEKQLADKGKTGILSTVNKDGSYTIEWNENKPSTQYSIDVTPELKESVKGGLPLFGNIIKALERMKSNQSGKMNAFGILPATWDFAIDSIIIGIKAGRKIGELVQEAIDYINEKHGKFDEAKFKALIVESGLATEEELADIGEGVPPPAPPTEKKKEGEEGKQKQSGFQQRSIEQAEDDVVKQIARDNEVYYTTMNQKEEYEKAKREFPDAQAVSDNFESLFPTNVKLEGAARLQVRRQVAMQVLSVEVSKQLAMGKDPKELGNKINRLQTALATDFAKGGQIGAMAVWRFMTPEGIVYQVTQKVKEQNERIEGRLSEAQKAELADLETKIEELQAKLQEEIAKTAERKADKGAKKQPKVFSEAKKKRKEELKEILRKKMFGQFNDVSNIARILFDKDTIEYAKLVVEEGAIDFNSFASEMVKDLGKQIKPILPELYKKVTGEDLLDAESKKQMEAYLQKQFTNAYGKSKIPSKKTPKRDIEKILEGINSGVLGDEFYKSLFLEKFGMRTNITIQEAAKLRELAQAVTSLPPTSKLYNIAVLNMAQYINNLYPRNFFSDLADTWVALNYAQMLSGVSTHILNVFSTGFGIVNSPFRNATNLSKWYKAIREGVKEGSFQTFLAYNPIYESTFIPAAWIQGIKVGKDIAVDTMMNGATTDKYIEGLVNQSGNVKVSTLEQDRYGKGKRYRPIKIFGVDINPYNKAKYIGRSLAAEDALMFQTAYEAELAGLALSIYREKGLRGKRLSQAVIDAFTQGKVNMEAINEQLEAEVAILKEAGITVNERVKNIRRSELMADKVLSEMGATREQIEGVSKLASSTTFTDDRNGVISRIAGLIGAIANKNRATQLLIKPFVPFTKVVANVTETALDAAPIYGLLRANNLGVTGWTDKILRAAGHDGISTAAMGTRGSQEYYEQMSRAWQGTIAFATMISLFAHSGDEDEDYEDTFLQLTGGYSEETRRNKSGRTNITPKYTIRVGDVKISYLNIPVLQIPLALIGNYNDYRNLNRYSKEDLDERMGLALAYAATQTMTMTKDMSFVQGVEDLTSTIYEVLTTEEKKAEKALKGLYEKYSSFLLRPLPQNNNMLLQIEKFFDPISYSKKEISDITAYSLGVQHIYGKPSVDIFGEAVKSYPAENTIPYTHWLGLITQDKDWKFLSKYNAIQPKIKNEPSKIFNSEKGEYEVRTMTADEFYNYTTLAGKIFKKKVQDYQTEVNPEERVRETVEIADKEVNALNNDISKLQFEAKEEAKAQLFLAKNVDPSIITKFYDIQLQQKREQKKSDVQSDSITNIVMIQKDSYFKITDEEKKVRTQVGKVPKNAVPLVLSFLESKGLKTNKQKEEVLLNLFMKDVINKEQYLDLKKVLAD